MKVRDIIKLLERDGWYLKATKGSHRQYKHPTKPGLHYLVNPETISLQELSTVF